MLFEKLLEQKEYFAYAKGHLYAKGASSNSYINGKQRISLNQGANYFDVKHSTQGNYSNLETFLKNVTIPYLKKGTMGRRNLFIEEFPFLNEDHGILVSRDKSAIIQPEKTKNPKAMLAGNTYVVRQVIPTKELFQLIKNSEVHQNESTKAYSVSGDSRSQTISCRLRPFTMKNNSNEEFYFEGINLQVKIRNEGGKYIIKQPNDANKTHHPFIYSNGKVCLSIEEFVKDMNIQKSHPRLSFKLNEDIASYIIHSQGILVNGYQEGVHPVNRLTQRLFPQEYQGAKHVA